MPQEFINQIIRVENKEKKNESETKFGYWKLSNLVQVVEPS